MSPIWTGDMVDTLWTVFRVIYVDLWSNTLANLATLLHDAIRNRLEELQTPGSNLLEMLKRVSGADVSAAGFKFGFKLDSIGKTGGPTLAQARTSNYRAF